LEPRSDSIGTKKRLWGIVHRDWPSDLLDKDQRSLLFRFTKRLIGTAASERCDNAKIGKMRSDRIDHRSLLTGEEMARIWFTRANSLPMPIDIGLGAAMGVVDITGRGLP
jgi:hypothetical protein